MTKVTLMPRPTLVHDTGARALTLDDLADREGEPRVLDIDLAERLGFRKLYDIRQMIQRNSAELGGYGPIFGAAPKNTDPVGRGRPGKEYWLNEGQALVICALSRTPKAAAIRKQIIDVFMAYRAGRPAPLAMPDVDAAMLSTPADLAVQLGAINARIDLLAAITARVGDVVAPGIRAEFRDMLDAADRRTVAIGTGATALAAPASPSARAEPHETLVGARAIAAHLSISTQYVFELASEGRLPVRRIGKRIVALAGDLDRWRAGQGDDDALMLATEQAIVLPAAAEPKAPARGRRGKAAASGGPDLLYGMPAIAAYLQLRKGQAYHLHEKGGLPTFRLGRIVCATRAAIDLWITDSSRLGEARS